MARWAAVEACRTYLRLVVGKNRWGKKVGEPATSDLVQDTILEGWRGFARFEGRTPDQLRAWLRAILIHAIIKAQRRPNPACLEAGDGAKAIAAALTPPFDVVRRNDLNEAIERALQALPEHYRAAIKWRLWEDSSFKKIGSRLGISDDYAQKLYGRAIARLRELLGAAHDLK